MWVILVLAGLALGTLVRCASVVSCGLLISSSANCDWDLHMTEASAGPTALCMSHPPVGGSTREHVELTASLCVQAHSWLTSLPPHSIGHTKSQGQSRSKGRKQLYLWMGRAAVTLQGAWMGQEEQRIEATLQCIHLTG